MSSDNNTYAFLWSKHDSLFWDSGKITIFINKLAWIGVFTLPISSKFYRINTNFQRFIRGRRVHFVPRGKIYQVVVFRCSKNGSKARNLSEFFKMHIF